MSKSTGRMIDDSPTIPRMSVIARMKFSGNVHVLDVVSSEDNVMPLHFKKGETVTKEVYLRVLIDVVKPWMETVASQKAICFSAGQWLIRII